MLFILLSYSSRISIMLQLMAVLSVFAAVAYGVLRFFQDRFQAKALRREHFLKSFDTMVGQLNSDNKATQLSAAILLRRYMQNIEKRKDTDLKVEAISEISALLREVQTGTFQKILGDGLAYAADLSKIDLMRTNLQDIYLGRKDGVKVLMRKTDLFESNLSFANIDGVEGEGIILYNAILFGAKIKNSNFTNANFRGADLSNASFIDVTLYGADFTNAVNLPDEIEQNLDVDHKFMIDGPVSTLSRVYARKKIFFSMPGCMKKEDEMLTETYRDYLVARGFDVIYYTQDNYPEFGQFKKVQESILKSSAMVVFGFKQIGILNGVLHPETQKQKLIENEWMSTPWSELEFGMGLMKNIPILIVKDKDINSGLFDPILSECFITTISSSSDIRGLSFNESFLRWLDMI